VLDSDAAIELYPNRVRDHYTQHVFQVFRQTSLQIFDLERNKILGIDSTVYSVQVNRAGHGRNVRSVKLEASRSFKVHKSIHQV
jgi:hypothetical protein